MIESWLNRIDSYMHQPLKYSREFAVYFIIFIALLSGFVFYWAFRKMKQRRAKFRQFGLVRGFGYAEKGDQNKICPKSDLPLFMDKWVTIENLLKKEEGGRQFLVFDAKYRVGSGRNQRIVAQTVACVRLAQPTLPAFSLAPEKLLQKIAHWVGQKDIDFPNHPEFSKKFYLKGPDEAALRFFFTPEKISFLERQSEICVESAPDALLFYRKARPVAPEKLEVFVREAEELVGVLLRTLT